MSEWPKICEGAVSQPRIYNALHILDHEIRQLKSDYFPKTPRYLFKFEAFYPDSPWLLKLQYRVFALGILRYIITPIIEHIAMTHFADGVGLYKDAFLRVAYPESSSNGYSKINDVLFSPLHYDRYDDTDTLSFWVPLCNISDETGDLAWTHDDEIRIYGTASPKDYHERKYHSPNYFNLLRDRMERAQCQAGDAYYFDRTLLHGSTYSKSLPRYTLDFRLAPAHQPNVLRWDFNRKMQEHAYEQLVYLRDYKFLKRHPIHAARAIGRKVHRKIAHDTYA